MSVERRLEQILGLQDHKDMTDQLTSVGDELIASGSVPNIQAFLGRILQDDLPQQVTKNTVLAFSKSLKELNNENLETVVNYLITALRQHVITFDEADYNIRELLFSYYVAQQQFKDAALALVGVHLDSPALAFNDQQKAEIYVKCAEAFLEDDETVEAETFVNKASAHMAGVPSESVALALRYRVTYARVLDANRKFVEAAMRYYDLSNTNTADVVQEDLLELLGKAVTCAVLGKTGPQRSRVLGLLFKDERIRSLEQLPQYASHSSVLARMYTEQILRRDELQQFEDSLQPHQKAVTGDGFTIPEKAVIEHNMLATGRIYDNITFIELGSILQLDAARAEKVAARMIAEDRLKASIDQTEGLLVFEEDVDALLSWDERIREVCSEVADCVDSIQQIFPQLAAY